MTSFNPGGGFLAGGGNNHGKYKIQIPKPSNALLTGGICAYVAGICLLFAFATPYWLVSWQYTFSPFKRMGLWEFCFENYRHPNYQYDKLFTGCHYVFNQNFLIIREWLLPGWLITVQAFFTMAFISSFGSQLLLAFLVTRWPLNIVLRNEWLLTFICSIGNWAAFFLVFLSIAVFAGQCDRRDWLPYPTFNYLSWGYYFAVMAMFFHAFAGLILYGESRAAKERLLPSEMDGEGQMVMQMTVPMTPTTTVTPSEAGGTVAMSTTTGYSGTDSFV